MTRKMGVSISRAAGDLVVAEVHRGKATILHEVHVARPGEQAADEILKTVLGSLPAEYRNSWLGVALSAGDLACADVCQDPPKVKHKDLLKVIPGLCEAQTAGKELESLSMDAVSLGDALQMVALETKSLQAIETASRESSQRLGLLTAAPVVLAQGVPPESTLDFRHGCERILVEHQAGKLSWRSHPDDEAVPQEDPERISHHGLDLLPRQVIPLSIILSDPDRVPNVLRGAPDAPRTLSSRFRRATCGVGAAAALLLGAAGFYFQTERARFEDAIDTARAKERELWTQYFPDREPIPGLLVRSMKEHLLDTGETAGAGDYPSALHFWAQFGSQLPDVETTGMTLESLDLSPEGGRLSAVVKTVPGDPLKNATLLEGQLNNSPRLSARGDYERRGPGIQVRLRMEFREDVE